MLKLRTQECLFKRAEEVATRGRSKNERLARVITSLRGQFKLKNTFSYAQMPKATYMYFRQKRLDKENPNQWIEDKILEIRADNKDYGYRRICGELRNQGIIVNKKKVQRIMQKLNLQVTSFTRKAVNIVPTKARLEQLLTIELKDGSSQTSCIRRLQLILPSSSIMKLMIKDV